MGVPKDTIAAEAELPIAQYKDQILSTISDNQVILVVAETGAGKSTQVPQYLLQAGYQVVVTQPRRLAARTLAERVAFEHDSKLGETIGFKVGFSTDFENKCGRNTRCLFVTDGLALVRELLGARKPGTVLVIDEVHEWNMNIEVLIAYVKMLLEKDKDLKVVLMSATLESEALSAYFGGAPVINVPGRLFPIEEQLPSGDMVQDTIGLLRQGRNVLVFQPGKGEIDDFMQDLRDASVNAEILPLHANLTSEEQAACFRSYGRPKCVVATNVAQTSVTIPDITAVVDSGMERRVQLVDGVEGLYLLPISLSDSKQRKGRGGRCAPGIYIDYCSEPIGFRPEFPQAEILRTLLDQTVLRLAQQGFDAEELKFFHQPDIREIHRAKVGLKLIGCMGQDGHVTEIGRKVAMLPVGVKYGRMLVEAFKLGVLSDVLTIVSILEVGGITNHKNPLWRSLCQGEYKSDLLAQLVVYNKCHQKPKGWVDDNGVNWKSLMRARDVRGHIIDALPNNARNSLGNSSNNSESIIKAICVGFLEHVYKSSNGSFKNAHEEPEPEGSLMGLLFGRRSFRSYSFGRRLNRDSVVPLYAQLVIGVPLDITPKGGGATINLIALATEVSPKILCEMAPQLIRFEKGLSPRWDYVNECVSSRTRIYFGKVVISDEFIPDPNHPEAATITSQFDQRSYDRRPPSLGWVRPVPFASAVARVQNVVTPLQSEPQPEIRSETQPEIRSEPQTELVVPVATVKPAVVPVTTPAKPAVKVALMKPVGGGSSPFDALTVKVG